MDLDVTAELRAAPAAVFGSVADLATYPAWLGIVGSAPSSPPHPDDPGPAWDVDLVARIGPLSKRKRVRMVRTVNEATTDVRFERVEHDGESHGTWILSCEVRPTAQGSHLAVHIHYSGVGWLPGLDLLLREQARHAGRRLDALLADTKRNH